EGNDEVRLAIAVLREAQPERFGIGADAPDHRLGRVAGEAGDTRAHRVFEAGERIIVRLRQHRSRAEAGRSGRRAQNRQTAEQGKHRSSPKGDSVIISQSYNLGNGRFVAKGIRAPSKAPPRFTPGTNGSPARRGARPVRARG